MNFDETLEKLFHHDRMAREAERTLLESQGRQGITTVLKAATDRWTHESDHAAPEVCEHLEVLANLWGQIGDEDAAVVLMGLLSHQNETVRQAAGAALVELAEPSSDEGSHASSSFDFFARAVRRELKDKERFGQELEELAFVLTEIENPRVVELLLAMLRHSSARVVAAGLEIAGEWGLNKEVRASLSVLARDQRTVTIVDEEEGEVDLSIGELATEVEEALLDLSQSRHHE